MRRIIPPEVQGLLTFLLYTVNTLFWSVPLLIMAFLKWLVPIGQWRLLAGRIVDGIACRWIRINNLHMKWTKNIHWDVEGVSDLDPNGWYLVLANHQSWVDILVLQKVLHRKIPLLKFFLKKELIWVPVLGLAWWALDFPFMKRYSKAYLEKHPEKKGRDMEITRKACRKFRTLPVSMMNFVEGTRFTPDKHRRQHSPYVHLLRPKAAGVALVLTTMGERIHRILNVTIAYPQGKKGFWAFLCGRVNEIKIRLESIPIDSELMGDYFNDSEFKARFQEWLNELWREKDLLLRKLLCADTGACRSSTDCCEPGART